MKEPFAEKIEGLVVNSSGYWYILVLFLLALLSLGGFYLLNKVVVSQQTSSAEINIAGRQRMLSQKINFLVQRQVVATNVEKENKYREELKYYVQLMRDSHDGLTKGSEILGLSPPKSPELVSLYFGPAVVFDKDVDEFLDDVDRFIVAIGEDAEVLARKAEDIYTKSENLLPSLDLIVSQYQMDNEKRIYTLQTIKWLVFGSTLILLFFSGVISRRSERSIVEITKAKTKMHKLSRAVESSSSAVIITDTGSNIEYVNPKFSEVTGYTREEITGQNLRVLQSGETPDAVYDDLWTSITSYGEWKGEFHNRKKDGSFYWCRNSISCVKDETGEITNFISIQDDMTHEHELSEQLSYQVSHDILTGLVNRYEFERRAERLLLAIRHDKTEHALCFMNLDQFKVVNDTYGHIAGDELLRQLGSVLQEVVRQRDTLARLGGDEFGVLMEHCSLEQARRVATSLRKAVQDFQFAWKEHSFRVSVSIGLVAITEYIPNLTELLKRADAACYMAKDRGRNRIHVYHLEDVEIVQRHGEMQWVARIYRAMEENRLCLYAQTIVPLNSSTDKHYELLIRMKDQKGRIISPEAFLPAAERYNLIVQLDRWVIKNAFTLLAMNPFFLKQINIISINLSGQSLADESFLEFVIKQLQDTGIKGEKICFEITETTAIANLNSAIKFILSMKALGCHFALDDFGSGLSSFGYLKNLPVNYLKIDGMFVKGIVNDPIDHAMVKSINEIGQVMGMQTIAEFVENDEIKDKLIKIGVNYAQGYGIGKPLAFDELLGRSNCVTGKEIA
jgi:diguanylate cyclase (GGDEF)-like protein/PAS domain S-box-containing protein